MSVFTHTYRFTLSLSELFLHTLYLSDDSLIQSLSSVSWTRGARPRGNLLYGQTWLETPDPVRSPKLSNHGRVQYSGGGPPGKRTYCTVPLKKSYDGEWSEVRTIWGPPTLGRFRGREPCVSPLSLLSPLSPVSRSFLSLSRLDL